MLNNNELEDIAKDLIETTELAGKKSIEIQSQRLKVITNLTILLLLMEILLIKCYRKD